MSTVCAIDFGTSNSAIALVERSFGRAAIAAYVDGTEGRLMRSMKSVLGSTRVGPQQRARQERRDDILANHGVPVAGTDFDRQIELAHLLAGCGFRARGPSGREVPSRVYFDLATWHLINTVYAPLRVAELRAMKSFYAEPVHHARLMTVRDQRLGHALTALASIDADLLRVADAARTSASLAGAAPEQVDAVYFTGGSTGLAALADRIATQFPAARQVRGNRFSSVAQGLGLHAQRLHGLV